MEAPSARRTAAALSASYFLRLQKSRTAGKKCTIPELLLLPKKHPACPACLPRQLTSHPCGSPGLLTSQNSPMKGLVTSSVSCFLHPLLILLLLLPCLPVTFTRSCLVFPRSQSVVTAPPPPLLPPPPPPEAAGLTGRGGGPGSAETCLHSCQGRRV